MGDDFVDNVVLGEGWLCEFYYFVLKGFVGLFVWCVFSVGNEII